MCTVGLALGLRADAPVVLAHNRDEAKARQTDPVHVWAPTGSTTKILAGRDREAGGTWFAVGPRLVAAVTNHRPMDRTPPRPRSRGDLVTTAAVSTSLAEVEAWIGGQPGPEYGPFHLLVTDGKAALWATNQHGPVACRALTSGIYVLRNQALDDEGDPVTTFVHDALSASVDEGRPAAEARLRSSLAEPFPSGPLVDFGAYGTVSSGLLFWGGERSSYATLEEPGTDRWVDRTQMLTSVDGVTLTD